MHFCPKDGRVMTRDTSTGTVIFRCHCGEEVEGSKEDALIASDVLQAGETTEMYDILIGNAAHDPVSQLVKEDCPECGLDYMAQIRVGTRDVVVWVCKCGYRASPSGNVES